MSISNYKIDLCKRFIKDDCPFGKERCKFAHGEDDLYCKFKENCNNESCRRIHLINEQKYLKYNTYKYKNKSISGKNSSFVFSNNEWYNEDIKIIINNLKKEFNEQLNKIKLENKKIKEMLENNDRIKQIKNIFDNNARIHEIELEIKNIKNKIYINSEQEE